MTATVDGTFCQPLLGETEGTGTTFPHWYTLLKVPASTTGTNCNDGGGGTGDCHDNTIYFSCCARIAPCSIDSGTCTNPVVNIRLADLPGLDPTVPGSAANVAFYERSTIYIDGVSDPNNKLCAAHGSP
jgi:hypothetical protein